MKISSAIANCLSNLGMRHIKAGYISGLCNTDDELREQWSEERWRALQWDDTLLSKNSSFSSILLNDSELNISKFCSYADNVCSLRFGNSQSHPLNGSVGFNECIRATYLSLLKDESVRFSTYISLARRAVSQQINKFVGRESILNGVSAFAMQLNCINETEDLGSTLFGDVPYRDILKKVGDKSF